MFLRALASALDPLDENRKQEMEEAEKESLPAMGGAIEDIIANPMTWYVADKAVDLLIGALLVVYSNSLNNKASKILELISDNSGKAKTNLNNYANSEELEADLKKKLQVGKHDV